MGIMARRRVAEKKKQMKNGTYQAPVARAPLAEKPKPTEAKPKRVIQKIPSNLLNREDD